VVLGRVGQAKAHAHQAAEQAHQQTAPEHPGQVLAAEQAFVPDPAVTALRRLGQDQPQGHGQQAQHRGALGLQQRQLVLPVLAVLVDQLQQRHQALGAEAGLGHGLGGLAPPAAQLLQRLHLQAGKALPLLRLGQPGAELALGLLQQVPGEVEAAAPPAARASARRARALASTAGAGAWPAGRPRRGPRPRPPARPPGVPAWPARSPARPGRGRAAPRRARGAPRRRRRGACRWWPWGSRAWMLAHAACARTAAVVPPGWGTRPAPGHATLRGAGAGPAVVTSAASQLLLRLRKSPCPCTCLRCAR
jgi:hypothetical protein